MDISKIKTDVFLYVLMRTDNDKYLAEKILSSVAADFREQHIASLEPTWDRLSELKKGYDAIKSSLNCLKSLFQPLRRSTPGAFNLIVETF